MRRGAWREVGLDLRRQPGLLLLALAGCGSALVAGVLPELLKELPGGDLTLFLFFFGGLALLVGAWARLNVRRGLGVVVFLGRDPDDPAEGQKMQGFVNQNRGRHLNFFYIDGDDLSVGIAKERRIGLARRVLHARLEEEAATARNGAIDFYLRCDLASAFELARAAFAPRSDGFTSFSRLGTVRVHQFVDGGPDVDSEVIELINGRWGVTVSSRTAGSSPIVTQRPIDNHPPGTENRCAIIVSLLGDAAMLGRVRHTAVTGDRTMGYQVDDRDVCGTEIVIETSLKDAPDGAISHHTVVRDIVAAWDRFKLTRSEPGRAEGRLFIHGPVAIVFALAAALPQSVEFVGYDPRTAK